MYLSLLLQVGGAGIRLLLLRLLLLLQRLGDGDVVLGGNRSTQLHCQRRLRYQIVTTYDPAIVADGLVGAVDGRLEASEVRKRIELPKPKFIVRQDFTAFAYLSSSPANYDPQLEKLELLQLHAEAAPLTRSFSFSLPVPVPSTGPLQLPRWVADV